MPTFSAFQQHFQKHPMNHLADRTWALLYTWPASVNGCGLDQGSTTRNPWQYMNVYLDLLKTPGKTKKSFLNDGLSWEINITHLQQIQVCHCLLLDPS